jgi:hypothetical protein
MKHLLKPLLLLLFLLMLVLLAACGDSPVSSSTVAIQPTPTAFHTTVRTTDSQFTVQLTITPDSPGPNVFNAQVLTSSGVAVTNVQVVLQATMLDMDMGTSVLPLQADGKGGYSASGNLSMSGNWQLRLVIHTPDHALHEATVQFKTVS